MQSDRYLWWWLVPLLLLTFWLGARGLTADAIWNDEYYSIYYAGGMPNEPRSLADVWIGLARHDPVVVPGFFLLLNGWGWLVNWQPPLLRVLPLLLGLLAVASVYRLGRDVFGPRVGLYAGVTLGTSAFFIHYLHELRMYSQLVWLVALTFWVYLRIIETGHRSFWSWVALLAGVVGLAYTQYYAFLVLIVIGAYHLLFVPKDRRWWQVVGVMLLAGLLFLPWLANFLVAVDEARNATLLHIRALSEWEMLERITFLAGNGLHLPGLVMLAAAAATTVTLRRDSRWAGTIWLLAGGLVGLLLITNAVLSIMHSGRVRYLLLLWPLVAVLIGLGLDGIECWGRRLGLGRFGLLVVVGWAGTGVLMTFSPSFAANFDGATYDFPLDVVSATLRDQVQADDVVLSYLPDGSPVWVAERNQEIAAFYFGGVPVVSSTMRMPNTPDLRAESVEFARQSLGGRLRVWLSYRTDEPAPLMLPDLLDAMRADGYTHCRDIHSGDTVNIALYTRESLCCTRYGAAEPTLLQFGDITLTGVDLLPVRDGGVLPVVMTWAQSASVPPYVYSVALHLWDADGQVVAQADYGLEIPATTCQAAQLDVRDLPPGDYTLRVAVYDWQTGVRLPGFNPTAEATGDMLPVTTVTLD